MYARLGEGDGVVFVVELWVVKPEVTGIAHAGCGTDVAILADLQRPVEGVLGPPVLEDLEGKSLA